MGKKKRWECWTLSEEEIDEIIKENNLKKPSKEELEKIATNYKMWLWTTMSDLSWDYILEEIIKNTLKKGIKLEEYEVEEK